MEEDFKIEEDDLETREVPVGGMNYGDYLQVISKKKYVQLAQKYLPLV